MVSLENKSDGIREAVGQLRQRIGSEAFDVVDYWPNDPDVIGIGRLGDDDPCVCIFTHGKGAGRFCVEHGGTVYDDVVIQGLVWAVRAELGIQK
jgi:hypothetical protein